MDIAKLAEPFEQRQVHWRAQTVTRSGDKALALAYLDARDVMDRLDGVCCPNNWQSKYEETPKGRVICSIGIRINDDWVWKADGAGDTAVEGEKGGISDAFKRAAVHWGVGRYLYRMDAVWVPCETYERNGKNHWKRWTADPWSCVRGAAPAPKKPETPPEPTPAEVLASLKAKFRETAPSNLSKLWATNDALKAKVAAMPPEMQVELKSLRDELCADLDARAGV